MSEKASPVQKREDSAVRDWKPRFFTIFAGQALSLFGSSLVQFALVWYLAKQTGSATLLATATLAGMLPQIVLSPFAGVLVDRWNRRRVMIVADASIALATLVLALLFLTGKIQIWHIYVLMGIRSCGSAFHGPAMNASISLMVPKDQLSRISGLYQTLQGLITIVSSPAGALLIEVMPIQGVLMIDIVTAIIAILPLFFFSIPQPPRSPDAPAVKSTYFSDLRAGFRYVRAWPGLVAIIAMAMCINFFITPTSSLIPLLVTKHFEKGALQLGFLDSIFGVGMIAGGLILSAWGGFSKKIRTICMGIAGIGLSILVLGLAPANMFWLALGSMALLGLAVPFANGPLAAILQTVVAPDMQGRVMSLMDSLCSAMTPLSLAIIGPIADSVGLRPCFIVSGLFCLFLGIASRFMPALAHLEDSRTPARPEARPAAQK
ncbi:MAG: MFS transporter [Rectinemataceae bacterium]